MKFLIVCLAIASCASAALLPYQKPVHQSVYQKAYQPIHHAVPVHHGVDAAAPVVRSTSDIHPDGQYNYEYETGNGIVAHESGLAAKSVQGAYSYTSPEGTPIQVSYVADENGYQPQGAHLPVAPETPAHVLRLVEYLRTHAPHEETVARFAPVHQAHHVAPVAPAPFRTAFQPAFKPAFQPAFQPAYKPLSTFHRKF